MLTTISVVYKIIVVLLVSTCCECRSWVIIGVLFDFLGHVHCCCLFFSDASFKMSLFFFSCIITFSTLQNATSTTGTRLMKVCESATNRRTCHQVGELQFHHHADTYCKSRLYFRYFSVVNRKPLKFTLLPTHCL